MPLVDEEAFLSVSAGSGEELPLGLSGNICSHTLRVTLFG